MTRTLLFSIQKTKPYVLPCQTSRFAVQKVTFRTAKGNLLFAAISHAPVWREVAGQGAGGKGDTFWGKKECLPVWC